MAWDKTAPQNDELLINYPALARANNDALELLTDGALQITNAKVAAGAAIVDTKLAQITTASKVSGAAITLLTNVPAGAGVLPDANSPHKLKADAADGTPQYLDSLINTTMFEISAGDLLELKDGGIEAEKLEGGSAAPGNYRFYGTIGNGSAFSFQALTEAMITDLDHDAVKIQGAAIAVPASGDDGQFLRYNHSGVTATWEAIGVTPASVEADTDSGTAYTNSGATVLSKAKTITSGNTVILIASGYASTNSEDTFQLKYGSTVVHTVKAKGGSTADKVGWSMTAVVTGLSGSITFSVLADKGITGSATAYGNLTILEIGGN